MFILNSFGTAAIYIMGPLPFLSFYIGAAIVSNGISHIYWKHIHPRLQPPRSRFGFKLMNPGNSLGASGAVSATSTVFALTYPKASLLLMGIVPVPALYAVGAFFTYDAYRAYTAGPSNTV